MSPFCTKLLIAVSMERVTLVHWRARKVLAQLSVSNDAEGLATCRELLARVRNVPVYILVDAVEEDYRSEVLPHVRGADRREMLARKLRQHYRGTPYCAAGREGRTRNGRRDDRYQFAALTNPELLAPWVDVIHELGLPLAGISLLPMTGAALVARAKLAAPHVLLVAATSGGLRLTYFRDGQFRLSRLARDDAGSNRDRPHFYVEEIANTRLYLHALHAATLDEPLGILLLDPLDTDVHAHQAVARENPGLECLRLGSGDLARLLKLKHLNGDAATDVLYLHLLALEPPVHNLAPAATTLIFRRLQLGRYIYRTCLTAIAGMMLWTGHAAWQLRDTELSIALAARERSLYEQQYRNIKRSFPAAPASAATLQQAVQVAERLQHGARTPERAMAVVSQALSGAPDIVLNELKWTVGVKDAATGSRMPVEAAAPTAAHNESAIVSGEVRPFTGDYRAAINAIRTLADSLARDPAVREVRIMKLPLNIDPALALSGNTRDNGELAGTADFTLLLTLRPRS